jgi:hypothetical protein
MIRSLQLILLTLALAIPERTHAQAVAVTASLDSTNLTVGQSTTLRVFAQVVPNLRTNADRIFSWYVDVVNTNGTVATANYAAMQKTASDRDPQTSSTGVSEGANRRGIYDTFINLPAAGVSNRVELMAIPVTAAAAGRTRFRVHAGTGVALDSDFEVPSKDFSQIFTGGDYAAAVADLVVASSGSCNPNIRFVRAGQGGAPGGTFLLTFTPCPGRTHTVEFRNAIGDATGWLALPGGPHNSGSVTITNTGTQRIFRLRTN